MKQIPCKTEKCLIYPICVNKTIVHCGHLYYWFELEGASKEVWEFLNKYFTEAKVLTYANQWYNKNNPGGFYKVTTNKH